MLEQAPLPDLISAAALVAGGFFLFAAGLGIFRMKDVLIRMHASTKAGTLGAGLIFIATGFHFGDFGSVSLSALTIIFLVVTIPVGAHAISRAAYRMHVPLWKRTHLDEWKGHYGPSRRQEVDPAA